MSKGAGAAAVLAMVATPSTAMALDYDDPFSFEPMLMLGAELRSVSMTLAQVVGGKCARSRVVVGRSAGDRDRGSVRPVRQWRPIVVAARDQRRIHVLPLFLGRCAGRLGGLIQTSAGGCLAQGGPLTKRSGLAA